MLSNSAGFKRYSRVLGFRKDTSTTLSQPCPFLLRKGKCVSYSREEAVRRQVAQEKEAELVKRATAMYTLQVDLLADATASGTSDGEEEDSVERRALLASLSANGHFSPEPHKRKEMIQRLVQELKQEPEYVHWSLDAAVAARLVERGIRHCPYSHRPELHRVLKRARKQQSTEDDALKTAEQEENESIGSSDAGSHASGDVDSSVDEVDGEPDSQAAASSSRRAVDAQRAAWQAERARVFRQLSPLQRCVACLLWQQTLRVPQSLLRDVRKDLEAKVEREMRAERWRRRRAHRSGGVSGRDRPTAAAESDDDDNGGADEEEEELAEAIETYLTSPEFSERVKKEEQRKVTHVVCRPALGVFDLSSLPSIVAYISQFPKSNTIAADTVCFFTGETVCDQRKSLIPRLYTEKELDVSQPTSTEELVLVLEWVLHVFNTERRLSGEESFLHRVESAEASTPAASTAHGPTPTTKESTALKAQYTRLSFRSGRVVLRSLTMQRCQLTSAEGLVASLHKRRFEDSLLALDLSENRLTSLRFLFALRAHFSERLLRLSLKNNSITRKPEYQEQVRQSLPRLTSLDGLPIRRPPLALPRAQPTSYTMLTHAATGAGSGGDNVSPVTDQHSSHSGSDSSSLSASEAEVLLDTIARLTYIWETRRIPHTALECKAFAKAAGAAALPEEEELNEDNYPHRYLHPSATFSFTMVPGLTLFDEETMKLDRLVELDESFTGMRLNALDLSDLRVFDVAMKNGSRNLLAGRAAMQRFGRGADNCYMACQYSLYPERMEVDHHLGSALVSIMKVAPPHTTAPPPKSATSRAKTATAAAAAAAKAVPASRKPLFYLVTLHGVMTWRLPSMRQGQCLIAAYDRTFTFVEKVLPAQNRAWERRRSPKVVVFNDQVQLRPATEGDLVYYTAHTATRLARLVVEFGLEACRDGVSLVTAVMERAASDAAESAALDALVFGPPPPVSVKDGDDDDDDNEEETRRATSGARARAAARELTVLLKQFVKEKRAAHAHASESPQSSEAAPVFHIFSLLDRPEPSEGAAEGKSSKAESNSKGHVTPWGSTLHDLPLSLVDRVMRIVNTHFTAQLVTEPQQQPQQKQKRAK